jgi:hypothetical protein
MRPLTDEAAFEIDLELPTECWDLDDLDEEQAALFRMCFVYGYVKATRDAKSGKIGELLTRVARRQQGAKA